MSQLYPKGAAHILGNPTKVDMIADPIKVLLYSGGYSAAHEFVSDLTISSIIARSGALASKTVTSGVFVAAAMTILTVSGSAFTHLVLYKDSGGDPTSPLICMFDIASYTPTGADITVSWNASGLFAIA